MGRAGERTARRQAAGRTAAPARPVAPTPAADEFALQGVVGNQALGALLSGGAPLDEGAQELLRYRMFRFASQIGFTPPYLYDRKLRDGLHRYKGPTLIAWGEKDHMVPRSHAEAYASGLSGARLEIISGAGHAAQVEKPESVAKLVAGMCAQ